MKPLKPSDPSRSALMSRVRQRGTSAELVVASVLRDAGFSYRLNVRSLPGSPDFANRKRHWAVFVHGCFWHHHTACKRATRPKANATFWRDKFAANRHRDAKSIVALRRSGFRVAIVWECETFHRDGLAGRLSKVLKARRVGQGDTVDH
jgi:DNA mismatch endonuclease (patch repair protein)